MNGMLSDDPRKDSPLKAQQSAPDATSPSQERKPLNDSAALDSEGRAVRKGDARPADSQDADDVLTHRLSSQNLSAADAAVLAESGRRTRRAFVGLAAGAAAAYGLRHYLDNGPTTEMIPNVLHGSGRSLR